MEQRGVSEQTDQDAFEQLIQDGETEEHAGRRTSARAFYERALSVISTSAEGSRASTLLRWIARTHHLEADHDAALDCLECATALAQAWGDNGALGHSLNIEAGVRAKQGQLDTAERLYLEARALALKTENNSLAAMIAQNLGMLADIRGDSAAALAHYEASLAEYQALDMGAFVCATYNNIGLLYTHREEWERAEEAFRRALEINELEGDVLARISVLVNFAEMWVERREFARGKEAVDLAIALARDVRDDCVGGQASKLRGVIARENGDYPEAERHLECAADFAMARRDLLLQAEVARERAECARQQGQNRKLLEELNRAHGLFAQLRAERELADLDRRNRRLEHQFLEVAKQWGESIEAKDRYTQGHCVRVANLACDIAELAGVDPEAMFWFRIGALLHDVGKLGIPEEVLNKVGTLSDAEWNLMRGHTTEGVAMLAGIEFPWDIRPIIESHHERWDGRGYPHGLAGEEIPLNARILCVADVYDALTSERSYKKALSHEAAVEMMRSDVGHAFDPAVYALFEDVSARRDAAT